MQLYNKEQAIRRMNELGTSQRPFIFIINYQQNASYIEEIQEIDPSVLLYDLNGFSNQDAVQQKTAPVSWNTYPEPFEAYQESFNKVRNHILAGNSFLTNLTCATPIRTNLSLKDIYERSHAMYKLWLKDNFTVFSPEIFVRIKDGKIYSYPMKGTINATVPDAEQVLMKDEKEAAEHATIVDLIRNDLSIVADHVQVSRYRYIDTLQTNHGAILQTSSEIQGTLPSNFHHFLGDLLFKLLPAGSITGAPKKKTVEIIAEAETYDRGFYTGIAGYFDGNNLDSAVMIRFIEQKDGLLFFKSGGGITSQSEAQSEYEEMKQKVYLPFSI